jgi:hypothetical protein
VKEIAVKQQPDGFAISFNRHTQRWMWKQTERVAEAKALGHVVERIGLASRRDALRDIVAEIDRRATLENRAAPAQVATRAL